jgi:hypothetical protein
MGQFTLVRGERESDFTDNFNVTRKYTRIFCLKGYLWKN